MSWDALCKPKGYAGLGFKKLRDMNTAFLAKIGWQMIQRPDKLWVHILTSKYGSPLDESHKQNVSTTWRGIRSSAKLLRKGLATSNFLHDGSIWVGKGDRPKRFTVQEAYMIHEEIDDSLKDTIWMKIWRLKGHTRANLFLWKLRHDVVPAMHFLFRRHIIVALCNHDGKAELHDFRDCWWLQKVWQRMVHPERCQKFMEVPTPKAWIDLNMTENCGRDTRLMGWRYLFREIVNGIWI